MFRIWYSTQSFARYIVDHTTLAAIEAAGDLELRRLYESDASNPSSFHRVPTHIKQILYLDAPDLIVELDTHPIFSVEITKEAGTGHNAFQRFGRLAAAVENGVPAFYVYPEAVYITRQTSQRWDCINPLILKTLEQVMQIYEIPALLFYYPTDFRAHAPGAPSSSPKGHRFDRHPDYVDQPDSTDPEMEQLLETIDLVINRVRSNGVGAALPHLLGERKIRDRRNWMQEEYGAKGGPSRTWSPETAAELVPTSALISYLRQYAGAEYAFSGFLTRRPQTLIYKVNAKFRGDPYPGALAALDYLRCRSGKTYEERDLNLAMAWGQFGFSNGTITLRGDAHRSIDRFVDAVRGLYSDPNRVLLSRSYNELRPEEIPRYFMQVRFGTTFTKRKEVRVYAYFCDAILFPDGALWREG